MASFVFPQANYITLSGALSDTNKTEIFTPNDIGAPDGAYVLGLRVVDSTGSVNADLVVHCQISSNDTERVLDRTDSVIAADFAYEMEGLPIALEGDGTIDLTGGNGHHWWLAVMPAMSAPPAEAQRG